ncbi:MAG: PAS domain S-box protein, partial [Candidatus Cloacimonetes bacterium]|nr:PAS domain S-box protein [Candidatus Cloacimonadota bacterium]
NAGKRMVGWVGENSLDKNISEAHPDWASKVIVEEGIPSAIANGSWEGETALLGPDGQEFPVSQVIMSHKSDTGDLEYVSTIIRDITKKKQQELALYESEARYRTLIEYAPEALVVIDIDLGVFVSVNKNSEILFGLTRKELLNCFPDDISPPFQPDGRPSLEAAKRYIQKAFKGTPQIFEWTHLNAKTKEEIFCEVRLVRLPSSEHNLIRGSVLNITDRKKREVEIYHLRNYLSNVINSMPSLLISVNKEGKVTQWNTKAEEITGIKSDEAKGKNLGDVFPQLDSNIEKVFESISSKEIKREIAIPFNTEDGIKYEDITIYPLTADGVEGAVLHIDDVTEKVRIIEQLNHRSKMDAIGQLAGGIAHDFNNMLAGIIGAAEVLQMKNNVPDEKNRKFVDLIVQTACRATDLTAKLLAFGRKGKIVSTNVDVHAIITDTIALLERSIDKRTTISAEKKAANYLVTGDNSQLQNVLMNLCINSSHAMPNGGEIQIRTRNLNLGKAYCKASVFDIAPGKFIELEVRDTGCGISSANLKKIFDPFYTTKKHGKGTGLGLSAVYGTVQDHHGSISVYSEVGSGTVFHICLPISEESLFVKQANGKIMLGTGVVLLVDDEKVIRITAKAILEDMGYEVLLTRNGMEAIEVFKKHHDSIDIVILDMIMPEMSGREIFPKIREIDNKCKVIISSGFSKAEDVKELIDAGLAGFIRKPYSQFELSRLLSKILKK